MAVSREKKIKSVEPNIFYGDIALLADESFTCLRLLKAEDGIEQIAGKFYAGKSIVGELGIAEFLPEIERELADHRRWRGMQMIEQSRWLLEIVQPKQGTLKERYVHLTQLGGGIIVETKQPFSFLQAATGINSFVWQGPSVKKDEDTEYSAGILALTGYTAGEINKLPGKYLSLITFEDSAAVGKIISDFSFEPGKKSAEAVYRIIRKDGSLRWVKESFVMLRDVSVRAYVFAGTVTDISSQKEYEIKLLESENRLLEINQAKDRFINILSHDLRAPFTSILGFSEILLNEPNLPAKEKNEYLTYIYEASQNQLQFINYLLDWSRLRTGSLKIESQRLKAQALIYNCVSILTGNAIRKNLSIEVDVSETLYVQADERLLTQVIINLLSNSIKFSPDNSTIEIHAGIFNESQAEFIVRDNGIGIPLEDQQKIFSIEKSFTKEGTHGEKGSGFGLALVKEIVVKHGGEIWFYSEPLKGAEFHFTLPLPSNMVLLVENNKETRNTYIDIINEAFPEFMILTAENGYEAMGLVANQTPNLIIFNHHMPLMNGLQFWEAMKRNETNLKVPFIVVCDSISEEAESAYIRQNVQAIIRNPLDRTEFLNVLQMTLH
jgi:PAS domain S-box-containing protein